MASTDTTSILAGAGTAVRSDPAQARDTSMQLTTTREADKSSTRKLIFVSSFAWQQYHQQHESTAKPIGLDIELAGVAMGKSLMDSGASRAIMRDTAYEKLKKPTDGAKHVCS